MTPGSQSGGTPVRRVTYFSGRVQGVGFRFTVQAQAANYAVSGFVRNLRDGRVELVAEGLGGELDRFHAAVENAMRGHITDRHSNETAASGEFACFAIRT